MFATVKDLARFAAREKKLAWNSTRIFLALKELLKPLLKITMKTLDHLSSFENRNQNWNQTVKFFRRAHRLNKSFFAFKIF